MHFCLLQILNRDNVQEGNNEAAGYIVSRGIVVILRSAVIPDGSIVWVTDTSNKTKLMRIDYCCWDQLTKTANEAANVLSCPNFGRDPSLQAKDDQINIQHTFHAQDPSLSGKTKSKKQKNEKQKTVGSSGLMFCLQFFYLSSMSNSENKHIWVTLAPNTQQWLHG